MFRAFRHLEVGRARLLFPLSDLREGCAWVAVVVKVVVVVVAAVAAVVVVVVVA